MTDKPYQACIRCGRTLHSSTGLCGPCQVEQRLPNPLRQRLGVVLAVALTSCTTLQRDKATVYTETGLRAAENAWHAAYNAQGDKCESKHEKQTPEMEACFGEWYDADEYVADVIKVSVAALQTYWTARAMGDKNVSFVDTMGGIVTAVDGLPEIAKKYFARVKGLGK